MIYGKYLEGESLNSIARILKEKGIKTIRGNTEWNVNSIRTILINEKYIGDAMAQKTFTTDYLTKARKENQGELQKYYVENAHEAIIPREVFYKVQEELHQRANIYKKSSKQETESRVSIVENTPYPRSRSARNAAVSTTDKSGLSTEKRKPYGDAKTG